MKNLNNFNEQFKKDLAERPFNPKETMQWLTHDRIISGSWGFHEPMALRDKEDETAGLLFKVNGALHNGFVLVTLAGNDTYTLRFYNKEFEEVKEIVKEVYCDVLQDTVDGIVEYNAIEK
jgi:hypothetical protein